MNRIHEELEKLNIATDIINKLELQLDEARSAFREIQSSWTQRLELLSKKLGNCIEKSRPYYQAKLQARQIQEEAQKAALRFERANSMHAVAKQQVSLTHESLDRQNPKDIDPACLEVLNHHVQRVNEAEKERIQSEDAHRRISMMVEEVNCRVNFLEKDLSRNIRKSRPYFDTRVEFTRVLEEQKKLIQRLEAEIRQKKADYTTSLNNLEEISEQIHMQRQLGERESGVGSESPGPPEKSPSSLKIEAEKSPEALKALETLQNSPNSPKFMDLLQVTVGGEQRKERSVSMPPDSPTSVEFQGYMIAPDANPESRAESRAYVRRPASFGGLQSGVILLAQQLSEYGWFQQDQRKIRAFSFPPEDLDVEYKTVPEGVKPFPTPPETPVPGGGRPSSSKKDNGKADATRPAPSLLTPIPSVSPPATPASSRSDAEDHSRTAGGQDTITASVSQLNLNNLQVPPESGTDSLSERSSLASFSGASIDDERLDQMLKSHRELIEEIEQTAERAKASRGWPPAGRNVSCEETSFDRGSASGDSCPG